MKMNSRLFNKHYYDVIQEWFNKRNFPAPEIESLPPTGVVISDDEEKPMAAGWLFKSDGGVSTIGHLVSNPEIKKEERHMAIDALFSVLTLMAKDSGFKFVSFATNIEKLNDRLENLGFIKTDKNVNHYRRILCQ